jgi:ribosomal protein S18 acetylase RimI-like enzyme
MEASSRGSSRSRSAASVPGRAARLRPLARAEHPGTRADATSPGGDRAAIERILRATGAFREDEVAVALELVDADASEGYRFVVAEVEGEVQGYACFGATPMTKGTFDLYWIAVAPARQGRGIGRALLRAAEDEVRAEGGRMLLVETAGKPAYAATRAVYAACGYREVARVPDFYEDGDDKIVFARRL